MRTLLSMAILLGVCAACSKQPAATAAPPANDPKAADSVPAKPTPAAVPNADATPNANTRPVYSPTTGPGYVVLNQYDPPMRIPISR
jgi:hypothetical protein